MSTKIASFRVNVWDSMFGIECLSFDWDRFPKLRQALRSLDFGIAIEWQPMGFHGISTGFSPHVQTQIASPILHKDCCGWSWQPCWVWDIHSSAIDPSSNKMSMHQYDSMIQYDSAVIIHHDFQTYIIVHTFQGNFGYSCLLTIIISWRRGDVLIIYPAAARIFLVTRSFTVEPSLLEDLGGWQ